MLIPRQIQAQIEAALLKGKTLVLFGPRQVGKTRRVQSLHAAHPKKSAYVSCDLPEVEKLLREPMPEELRRFAADRRLLVLDGAQRAESIGLALKILHEHFPKTQFLVTGSSSFELGKPVKEPLTGRNREFPLYPRSRSPSWPRSTTSPRCASHCPGCCALAATPKPSPARNQRIKTGALGALIPGKQIEGS
jgi:hypothetical protein